MFRRSKTKEISSTEDMSEADKVRLKMSSLPKKQYFKESMSDKEIRLQLQVRASEVFLILKETKEWIAPAEEIAYRKFLDNVEMAKNIQDHSDRQERFKKLISDCDLNVKRFNIGDEVSDKLQQLVDPIVKTYHFVCTNNGSQPDVSGNDIEVPNINRSKVLAKSLPNAKQNIILLMNAARTARNMNLDSGTAAKDLYDALVKLKSDLNKCPLQKSKFGGFVKGGNELNKLIGAVHKLCPPEPKKGLGAVILSIKRGFGGGAK